MLYILYTQKHTQKMGTVFLVLGLAHSFSWRVSAATGISMASQRSWQSMTLWCPKIGATPSLQVLNGFPLRPSTCIQRWSYAAGPAISTGDASCSRPNRTCQPCGLQQRVAINSTYSLRWKLRLMFTNLSQQTLDV